MSTVIPVTTVSPEEVVRQLRALRDQIPEFTLRTPADRQPLTRAANIGIGLVHASINAIAASPALQSALGRDAETLRSETELIGRWSEVIVELDALRLGLTGSLIVRRHRLGGTALKAYQVSVQLARYKENGVLLPHIDAMRQAANFPKRRPAQPQPDPQPKPQQK